MVGVEAKEKCTQHGELCKKLSPTGVANEDELLSRPDPSAGLREMSQLPFDSRPESFSDSERCYITKNESWTSDWAKVK